MNKPFTPLKVSAGVRRRPLEEIRGEERRTDLGSGLHRSVVSPSPNPAQHEIFQILRGGVDALSLNDHGRPWPYPSRATIARLLGIYDFDLCAKAAREAREIVQAQDRAPNISALFEKKLRELAAESDQREKVREAIGESLREGGPCR